MESQYLAKHRTRYIKKMRNSFFFFQFVCYRVSTAGLFFLRLRGRLLCAGADGRTARLSAPGSGSCATDDDSPLQRRVYNKHLLSIFYVILRLISILKVTQTQNSLGQTSHVSVCCAFDLRPRCISRRTLKA